MSGAARMPGRARQHVRVALREQDEVALLETDRWLADDVSPARAPRDQVVLDDALGARHHRLRDLARRRRLRHPRRAQLEVEVHRAAQADRAKHVREHVSGHARSFARRTRGHPVRTSGQVGRALRTGGKRIGRCAWLRHHTARSVGHAGAIAAPARYRKDQVYDDVLSRRRPRSHCQRRRANGRANALADRLEHGPARSPAFASALTDAEWQTRVPEGRAQDRRRRASRRDHVPAGDPAGADCSPPASRSTGVTWDVVHAMNAAARQGARRASRKTRRSTLLRRNSAAPRPRSGRSATRSSIGPPRCRSTPTRRSRASSCSRTTPSGTATTTWRGSVPRWPSSAV